MIVYRSASAAQATDALVRRLESLAERGDAVGFLAEMGALEQGLLDAVRRERDGWSGLERSLRQASLAAGSALLARRRDAVAYHLRRAAAALGRVRAGPLPGLIEIRPPEGFAHYGLDPAAYAGAAAAYRRARGERAAAAAVVVGVRSIGTGLSAVVAAELGAHRTLTVRPRGGAGGRHVSADSRLLAALRGWLGAGGDVLVVDEGPGATGETLAAVASWLGVAAAGHRLILFPSRDWGLPLAPAARRAWFEAAPKYVDGRRDRRPADIATRLGLSEPENLSSGRWRRCVAGARSEPACVVHERMKYRARDARRREWLIRYAGLGRWGDATLRRAVRLAEAGLGPRPLDLVDGFLVLEWVTGRPVTVCDRDRRGLAFAVGRYLCGRARLFTTGRAADPVPIIELLLQNTTEALGPNPAGLAGAVRRLERLPPREAVVPDARLATREWVRGPLGFVKVDALDHGDGLRMPGPCDPAWDLAGAAVELGLDPADLGEMAARWAAAAGQDPRLTVAATAAYVAPYAAAHLGQASLSAAEAGDESERHRHRMELERYRRALAVALEACA